MPENPKLEERDNKQGDRNFWLQLARYSQLAFVLPAATFVGWLIGVALDHWLHTGWLYLAGPLLASKGRPGSRGRRRSHSRPALFPYHVLNDVYCYRCCRDLLRRGA